MRFFTRFPALTGAALLPALSAYSQEAKPARTVDFMREVKPLIEGACINCHGPNTTEKNGDYLMHTKEAAFKGGESYENEVIKPGDADDSPVYWMTTEPEDGDLMPPKHPLSKHQQEILKVWIDTGAEWPDGVTLQKTSRVTFQSIRPLIIRGGPFKPSELETLRLWAEQGADWPEGVKIAGSGDGPADDLNLVKKIRELIVASSKEKSQGDMKNYESTIPKTGVKFEMVAIPGGEFTMGSPASEANRNADEGPQRKLKISPFWMGKFEVTWDMYEPFMITSVPRNKDGSPQKIDPSAEPVDVVSAPTTPYVEMSFGMGTQGYPAISMTQHAALKFCEWLSAQTGQYYRLPTEAEW
ncbi:MAG: SUMF1/EgtB/PvdO family nonheme iron enzyme, partial [Verrucomicrobiae bacterium]|nr:SUMF1/EgtB/PvdO family nonheme iron enzyme [Verrucomicrobiae bacterium]